MRFFIGAVLTAGLCVFGNISAMADSSAIQIENIGDVATELGNLVNQARASNGLNMLTLKPELMCAAQSHAMDIGEKRLCSVNGSNGNSPWDVAKSCNTAAYGVLIGCGYMSAKDTVDGWLSRQDTRESLLNPSFAKMGISMRNNFWVVFFGYGE
jgi:uncharacterized protein YkwD